MVRVSGLLTPRLSRLIIDANLDMKGWKIVNLGEPTDPGDAVTKNYVDTSPVSLSRLQANTNLDMRGYKIVNLGEPTEPGDAATFAALLDAIYPSVFYNNYLAFNTTTPPSQLLVRGYLTGSRRILNARPDPGNLLRPYGVELVNSIVYVNDARHSHDLDTQDNTTYNTTATTDTELLRIDYGRTINAKEIWLLFDIYVSSGTGYYTIDTSVDGISWTVLDSVSTTSTSAVTISRVYSYSSPRQFRYLRFLGRNSTSGAGTNLRVKKVVITE